MPWLRSVGLFVAVALTLSPFGLPGPLAEAQEATPFERVQVSLWPEYDEPEMLVIYRISLPSEVVLPGTVRLRIPVSAGQPNAVAEANAAGELLVADYERAPEGQWAVLTIDVGHPVLQVEYYDPFERDGASRSYRYVWPGEHEVGSFEVQVQEPAGARDMNILPASPGGFPGPSGLPLHTIDLGSLPAGQERVVTLDWLRDSDEPSVARTPVPPPTPQTGAPSPDDGGAETNIWYRLIFGLGAAAVAAIAVWLLLFRGQERRPKGDRRGKRAAPRKRFCPGCGERVGRKDRFCGSCGRALR